MWGLSCEATPRIPILTLLEVPITPIALAQALSVAAAEKKATHLVTLNVEKLVSYCDYFVICSGNNSRQVRAIAQHAIDLVAQEHKVHPLSSEGLQSSRWILVDFGDVILHVFDEELRAFYDLDGLWGDAPRVSAPVEPAAPPPVSVSAPA